MAKLFSAFSLIFIMAIIFTINVVACPPVPGTYDPQTMTFYDSGLKVPVENSTPGPLRARGTYRGVFKFPVLFIHANDEPSHFPVSAWAEQLFTIGTHSPGSMRDYYREVSYGQFDLDGITLGWFTADHEYEYYHENNWGLSGGAAKLAREAVLKAEAQYHPNWADFDNDHDGEVDGIIVIHQGPGGENGDPKTIWSHVSNFDPVVIDGLTISRYSIQPETKSNTSVMETIGTICHEQGHVLGLPDLYDIAYTEKYAPIDKWCIMAGGSSGGNPFGARPNHFCGWSKYHLGWVNEIIIDEPGTYTIDYSQANSENSIYIIPINDVSGDLGEYFLLEDRWMDHSLIFDHLPSRFTGGLMIYHNDEMYSGSNTGNKDFWHAALADAGNDPDHGDPVGRDLADCGFSADEGNDTFGPDTVPNTDGHRLPSNITISNVSNRGSRMTFTVSFKPTIILQDFTIEPLGNKTYEIAISLQNLAACDATSVTATLQTGSTSVAIDTNSASFGTIAKHGGTATNDAAPFVYHTTGEASEMVEFTVIATADGGYQSTNQTFRVPINPHRILIVDDDETRKHEPQNFETYFQEPLDVLGYEYETWEVLSLGYPSASVMSLYDLVMWNDGKSSMNTPSGEALNIIRDYLDSGGDLFWSSHEFIYSQFPYSDENDFECYEPPVGSFIHDYLHITKFEQDEYYYSATGASGSIFDGKTFQFEDVFTTGENGKWWPDDVEVDAYCTPLLVAGPHECEADDEDCQSDSANNCIEGLCAYTYQGDYRLMFMTIPFHGLSNDPAVPNNRQDFFQGVLTWFGVTTGSFAAPGVDIDLNQSVMTAGDDFKLSLRVANPGPAVDVDLFVILDVYSAAYYFWPGWTETLDFQTRSLETGYDTYESILEFVWPDDAGTGSDTRFWAAVLDHDSGELLGNYDFCNLSWE